MWHIASICYTMSPCSTLPDVVDIYAVKKVNGHGSEAGWQRYAPCPSSTPVGSRSQTLGAPSGKDTVQFDPRGFAVYVAPAPKFTVQIGAATDTLCITGLGRITTRSCP